MRHVFVAGLTIGHRRATAIVVRYPLDMSDTAQRNAVESLDGARAAGLWPTDYRQAGPIEAGSLDELIGEAGPRVFPDGAEVVVVDGVTRNELDPIDGTETGWWRCEHLHFHPPAERPNREHRRHPRAAPRR